MQSLPLNAQQRTHAENYLKTYATNLKLLRLDKYHKEFFGKNANNNDMLNEVPLARAKMFEVRHFILELENSDEKLFLYYHYVKCESVARCAELLGISRRTGFRLKDRALALAYQKMTQISEK